MDDHIYMDTPEDMEKLRQTKAQNIIEKFCFEHHYTERKQVMKDGKINELIEQIYKETDLSNRKIADLLEIGASTVSYLIRGINRGVIFNNNTDKDKFLEIYSDIVFMRHDVCLSFFCLFFHRIGVRIVQRA